MQNRRGLPRVIRAILKANCFDCRVWMFTVEINMKETATMVRNLSSSVSEAFFFTVWPSFCAALLA
jgi:hypothetical protein